MPGDCDVRILGFSVISAYFPARLLWQGEINSRHFLLFLHRLARRFRDVRIQALFSFQDLYVGLSPYSAPGVFSLLPATEITDGGQK